MEGITVGDSSLNNTVSQRERRTRTCSGLVMRDTRRYRPESQASAWWRGSASHVIKQALALAQDMVRGEIVVRQALGEGMSVAEAFRRHGVL
jgi:hypothetical protein